MLNNKYFLWGAGTYGERIVDFMKNDLVFEGIIDNNPKKQGNMFRNLPVISYEEAKQFLPEKKIVITPAHPRVIQNTLLTDGFIRNKDFYTYHQFLPKYYWEKNRTVISLVGIVASTACNMNCKGCQTYADLSVGSSPPDASKMKRDVDNMFNHADSIFFIVFNCGESLLYDEAVAEVASHIYENYQGRYHTMSVITNGTIVPSVDTLKKFAKSNVVFSVSDYPEHKKTRIELIEKCNEHKVPLLLNSTCNTDGWHDFGDPRILLDENPKKIQNGCWTANTELYDGHLFLCAAQAWAEAVAGIGERKVGDSFDVSLPKSDENREAFYRVISAQPENGYVSHCMRCNGMCTPFIK